MIEKLKNRLVADWRHAHQWWSVRINAIGALFLPLLTMVPALPPEVQTMFPLPLRALLAGLWCIAAIGARLVTQRKSQNG